MLPRIAGSETVALPDNEKTFDDVYNRIQKTIEILEKADPKDFVGKEDIAVSLKAGPHELNFTGKSYLLDFVIPNFYFHTTTTYALLRQLGVPVGKMDFLGKIN